MKQVPVSVSIHFAVWCRHRNSLSHIRIQQSVINTTSGHNKKESTTWTSVSGIARVIFFLSIFWATHKWQRHSTVWGQCHTLRNFPQTVLSLGLEELQTPNIYQRLWGKRILQHQFTHKLGLLHTADLEWVSKMSFSLFFFLTFRVF